MKKKNKFIFAFIAMLICLQSFGINEVIAGFPIDPDPPPDPDDPPEPTPIHFTAVPSDVSINSGDSVSLSWTVASEYYEDRGSRLYLGSFVYGEWEEEHVSTQGAWSSHQLITYVRTPPPAPPNDVITYYYRIEVFDENKLITHTVRVFVHGLPDSDGDGLLDTEELAYGTDPNDWDTDDDGLSDGFEVGANLSPLADADKDNDGLTDAEEILTYGTSPHIYDSDGDGLSDYEEVIIYFSDPLDEDTDNDGLTDQEEAEVYGTNPNLTDTDGDGVSDYDEIWTYGTDPDLARWTVLFYLDGDLVDDEDVVFEGALIKDGILKLQGSSNAVNLVSLLDLKGENSTYQYYKPDHTILIDDDPHLGELNMGDGATLENFINWGQTNYPAEYYLLILFDHGMGIMNKEEPHEIGGVCYDGDDYLTPAEIKNAISGKNIEILGMDACLMGSTEIHYALRNEIEYYIASEEVSCAGLEDNWDPNIPETIKIFDNDNMSSGWPYELIVPWLKNNPTESPETIANEIVTIYYDAWSRPFYIDYDNNTEGGIVPYTDEEMYVGGTLSNVKSSYMQDIQLQFKNLCSEMINLLPNNLDKFYQVRSRCLPYARIYYIDLYDLLNELLIEFPDTNLENYVQTLQSILNSAIKNQVSFNENLAQDDLSEFSHGMSLYFPNYNVENDIDGYWPNYANTNWSIDTNWATFLNEFCQPYLPIINSPSNIYAAYSSSNNQISWVANDIYSGGNTFEIYINGGLQYSGDYENDIEFTYIFIAPKVPRGRVVEYEYKCRVYNKYGYTEDVVIVTVGDF